MTKKRKKSSVVSSASSPATGERRSSSRRTVSAGKRTGEIFTYKTSIQFWALINQRLPNPDTVLRKKGASISIYRELLYDAHLSAALESREAITLANDWELQKDDCPARLYNSIEKWFFSTIERKADISDLNKSEIIDNLLDVIYWGYNPVELVWGYQYGLWVPIKIVPKPPEWFTFFVDENGIPQIRFLDIAHPVYGIPPPDPWTLMCLRIKPSFENPYGRGVAQRCFWPLIFKRAGIEFWMNFMERFGTPWVKGVYENPKDDTALADFANELKGLVQDAIIALTRGKEVELLETHQGTARVSEGFRGMCDYFDGQMSKTILGHGLSMDIKDKGSYAASKGAMTVRGDIGEADTLMVSSFFNDVVNLIFRRNGFDSAPRPKVSPFRRKVVEIERAQRDESLVRGGVRFKKIYYQRAYALREDEFTVADIDKINASKQPVTGIKDQNDKDKVKNTPGGDKDE